MIKEQLLQTLTEDSFNGVITIPDFKQRVQSYAKMYHTEQCAINGVVFKESDLCDDSCKYYCTKGFTQERECLTDGYCKWCKQTPCERLNWSHPLEDDDE